MTRNEKGLIGWAIVSAITTLISAFIFEGAVTVFIPILCSLVIMVIREHWQYITKQTKVFEWEDIAQYSVVIMMTSIMVGMVLAATGIIE